ncbi:flagellar biosynthetic protein FliR, partial [Salmonella enterica subsp. enterica serovar Infantis]
EVFLGLLSRFAPQMKAFAISLTVKRGIAVLIMLLYFSPVLTDNVLRLYFQATGLISWF